MRELRSLRYPGQSGISCSTRSTASQHFVMRSQPEEAEEMILNLVGNSSHQPVGRSRLRGLCPCSRKRCILQISISIIEGGSRFRAGSEQKFIIPDELLGVTGARPDFLPAAVENADQAERGAQQTPASRSRSAHGRWWTI